MVLGLASLAPQLLSSLSPALQLKQLSAEASLGGRIMKSAGLPTVLTSRLEQQLWPHNSAPLRACAFSCQAIDMYRVRGVAAGPCDAVVLILLMGRGRGSRRA
jgi:hypothetical protein